jgi:hypothetical protein
MNMITGCSLLFAVGSCAALAAESDATTLTGGGWIIEAQGDRGRQMGRTATTPYLLSAHRDRQRR